MRIRCVDESGGVPVEKWLSKEGKFTEQEAEAGNWLEHEAMAELDFLQDQIDELGAEIVLSLIE